MCSYLNNSLSLHDVKKARHKRESSTPSILKNYCRGNLFNGRLKVEIVNVVEVTSVYKVFL